MAEMAEMAKEPKESASNVRAKGSGKKKVAAALERRVDELGRVAAARAAEIESLSARVAELQAQVEARREADTLRREAEKEAASLRAEVKALAERAADLEKALATRDALVETLRAGESGESGESLLAPPSPGTGFSNPQVSNPKVASPWTTLFGGDAAAAEAAAANSYEQSASRLAREAPLANASRFSDSAAEAATLEASAQAARLQIVLRQRERALAALARAEAEGAAMAPALEAYRSEISALEAEAARARAELAARDDAAAELRGRLDVELNILRRESAKTRATLVASADVEEALKARRDATDASDYPSTTDLSDLSLTALETKLESAQVKSAVAFDALGSTLGSAKEDGKGGAAAGNYTSDANGLSVRLIDVQFSIPFETRVGQDLYVVGTWCDWDVERGLALRYVEGGKWQGTMPLHPGYNYEYKYVVMDRREGARVGDPVGAFPDWGFAEPALVASPKRALADDSSAYAAVWQKGNNKALALDNISTKGLHHIEARDEWVPDPKNAPIQLVGFDGEVKEIVGSTRLLMECVNRADAYLEEVRAQMEEMYDIAAAAVRKRRAVDDDDDDDDDDGLIIA